MNSQPDIASYPKLAATRVVVVGAGTAPLTSPDSPVGIGFAVARTCAAEGAAVVCVDRDAEAAARTVAGIRAASPEAEVQTVIADVSEPDTCINLLADLGTIDGVVLGVGTLTPRGLTGTAAADWDRAFAINARSHALISTAALEQLPDQASIVMISSISALSPGLGMPAYEATKAAGLAVMRSVAVAGASRGIRCNAVLAGAVDTPMGAASAPPAERNRRQIPLGRRATPWDVAQAVSFLLSSESAYITGHALPVDGGLHTLS